MENNSHHLEIIVVPNENEREEVATSKIYVNKPRCCIYTVPEFIRRGKKECYRPLAISIGPAFYNDHKLKPMQELKGTHWKHFISHPDNACRSTEPYMEFVRVRERKIHECYQQHISLPSDEFIQMIVLDATFLIYLFLLNSRRHDRPSCRARRPSVGNSLRLPSNYCLGRDLFLEENQLPFFVLKGIYNIAFGNIACSFTDLALEFIGRLSTGIPGPKAVDSIISSKTLRDDQLPSILHLVDLRRECCCLPFYDYWNKSKRKQYDDEDIMSVILDSQKIFDAIKSYLQVDFWRMCCCLNLCCNRQDDDKSNKDQRFYKFGSAKQLSAAGVKFELSESHNLLDITFDKTSGVLKIPKLTLVDSTEPALRSILLFEQCHYNDATKRYFTDYIVFLDQLIDTVHDIQLLQETGILDNDLGFHKRSADLFNQLTINMLYCPSNFAFSKVSKGLKVYASSHRNRWKAILWSRYFNHPWAIISVIYAVIILILTVLQTITGFLQLQNNK